MLLVSPGKGEANFRLFVVRFQDFQGAIPDECSSFSRLKRELEPFSRNTRLKRLLYPYELRPFFWGHSIPALKPGYFRIIPILQEGGQIFLHEWTNYKTRSF